MIRGHLFQLTLTVIRLDVQGDHASEGHCPKGDMEVEVDEAGHGGYMYKDQRRKRKKKKKNNLDAQRGCNNEIAESSDCSRRHTSH